MRLRFTIRDLLWLVVVVALAVGWWLERNRLTDDHTQQVVKIVELEKEVRSNTWEKFKHAIPETPIPMPNPNVPVHSRDLQFEPSAR